MSGFGLAHIKQEACAIHPDDTDAELSPAAYEKQLAAYQKDTNDLSDLNKSGMQPVEYKVLIEPESVEQTSAGGIVLAMATTEKEKMAQVKGKLIAVGGNAFEDWQEPKPKVGDSVYFAKYAGYVIKGIDAKEYRLANDKDISAVLI